MMSEIAGAAWVLPLTFALQGISAALILTRLVRGPRAADRVVAIDALTMIAIGVTATPVFVRLTRGQTLAAKVEDYVEAARAVGNPRLRIALRHLRQMRAKREHPGIAACMDKLHRA